MTPKKVKIFCAILGGWLKEVSVYICNVYFGLDIRAQYVKVHTYKHIMYTISIHLVQLCIDTLSIVFTVYFYKCILLLCKKTKGQSSAAGGRGMRTKKSVTVCNQLIVTTASRPAESTAVTQLYICSNPVKIYNLRRGFPHNEPKATSFWNEYECTLEYVFFSKKTKKNNVFPVLSDEKLKRCIMGDSNAILAIGPLNCIDLHYEKLESRSLEAHSPLSLCEDVET